MGGIKFCHDHEREFLGISSDGNCEIYWCTLHQHVEEWGIMHGYTMEEVLARLTELGCNPEPM